VSNSFSFFGHVFDGGGNRIGYGHIITFTGGDNPNAGWGASQARTLEDITVNSVVHSIKQSGKMVLAVPFDKKLGNHFMFKERSSLPRFTIEIFEKVNEKVKKKIKDIFFLNVEVGKIVPSPVKNVTISGVEQPFENLSMLQVFMTVPPQHVTVQ
jgi:hypothetical protein